MKQPLTWQNGKYILADNILTEVVSHRDNVYRVRIVGKKNISYLVTDGENWSHGDTLKQARDDLLYKAGDRSTDKFKDLTLDSKLTLKEAIACYRSITGACSTGVKHFIESASINKRKKYTVREMIKLTEGQYGSYVIKKFFDNAK